jgi:hypothetical protein
MRRERESKSAPVRVVTKVMRIDSHNGTVSPIQDIPSGGNTPRNFTIDPTGLMALSAKQESNNITPFRLASHAGCRRRRKNGPFRRTRMSQAATSGDENVASPARLIKSSLQ